MATLNISLTDKLKKHVSDQVEIGLFSSDSEYLRSLIRRDIQSKAKATLESEILKGFHGNAREFNAQDWDAIKTRAKKRL